jgi:uncharacterized protein (TIGR03118 family)
MLAASHPIQRPSWRIAAAVAAVGLLLVAASPVAARNINAQNHYTVTNLVSDVPGWAAVTDPNLVNGWGITASPTGSPWWVADNGTDSSTLYTGAGGVIPLVVSVPGGPTGTVFNTAGAADFNVSNGTTSAKALFIFATEGGQVLGWSPSVNAGAAIEGYTADDGAIYKGLAIGSDTNGAHLYAADFHNNKIDVIAPDFTLEDSNGRFVDPGLPAGFAPFGIQNLGGTIFVTYAMQDADAEDEIAGPGLGVVDAFGTDGSFLGRVATGGDLNAPWGLAWAPAGFGRFSGDLLVGNFGDGRINAYAATPDGWEARGHLKDTSSHPISIDGLWGIGFGNGGAAGPLNVLYFAAGPEDEAHGLFGSIAFAG